MDAMNVNVAGMSRIQMAQLMDEMRETARQQIADAITDTPMTVKQISAISGQTYYTDVSSGVCFSTKCNGGFTSPFLAKERVTTKFIRDIKSKKRKYAEVDDDGNIVENGGVITKTVFEEYYSLNPYFESDY